MNHCHTYLPVVRFSRFGLDPETPSCDYEIHFVKASDPAYIPPDSEAWPLYFRVVLDSIKEYPGALAAITAGIANIVNDLKGRRALPPHLLHLPAWGPREYPDPNPEQEGNLLRCPLKPASKRTGKMR